MIFFFIFLYQSFRLSGNPITLLQYTCNKCSVHVWANCPPTLPQEMYHKQWHEDLQNLQTGFRTRRLFRLMWYAYKVEQLEIDQETEEAKKMRDKFINQITQKKTYK